MKFKLKCLFLFFLLSGFFFKPKIALAENEILEAKVERIIEEKQIQPASMETGLQLYQKLELLVKKGSLRGEKILIENGLLTSVNVQKYKPGDLVQVQFSHNSEGNDVFYIIDYVRRNALFWLFVFFSLTVILVAGFRGAASLLGMAVSFLVIQFYILPQILAGAEPVRAAVSGTVLIIPIAFYLSHGLNKKTSAAVIATVISLIITGFLAKYFVEQSRLTGFAAEEAGFLQHLSQGKINIKNLLLAGIIIGILGVLDDITISQSAIVFQLKKTDSRLKPLELFKKAMDVGRDHISSMVNTLILVYTGASLPLLLLFINNPHPFAEIINYEIIADEIVRTLTASIGLILAVPITTIIAILMAEKSGNNSLEK